MNLLTFKYWFATHPAAFLPIIGKIFLVAFIALTAVGIIAKIYSVKKKMDKWTRRAIDKAGNCLLSMGLLGLLLYFFDYEKIPILSMRIFYIAWLIILIIWAYFIYKFITVEIPAKLAQKQEREQVDKWLPQAKKK
ncbi:MAG: hypothetical protein ACOYUZ_05425 [Patescibacteria group bacterium]